MAARSAATADALGVQSSSDIAWVRKVEEGLPVRALKQLQALGALSEEEFDAIIPRRTRRHQRERGRLSASQSDRVARAARAFATAHRAFADPEKGNRWMKRPHRILEDERPIDLLRSSTGTQIVLDALGRIEHGVYG